MISCMHHSLEKKIPLHVLNIFFFFKIQTKCCLPHVAYTQLYSHRDASLNWNWRGKKCIEYEFWLRPIRILHTCSLARMCDSAFVFSIKMFLLRGICQILLSILLLWHKSAWCNIVTVTKAFSFLNFII
jgi:hypothetical protein